MSAPQKKFVLSRDMAKVAMSAKTKTCKRCKVEKPNDFAHFDKRICGLRDQFATTDVCKSCRMAKLFQTLESKKN